jgi:hypothetical protein
MCDVQQSIQLVAGCFNDVSGGEYRIMIITGSLQDQGLIHTAEKKTAGP